MNRHVNLPQPWGPRLIHALIPAPDTRVSGAVRLKGLIDLTDPTVNVRQSVLLIDDDEAVRTVMASMVDVFGFEVLQAQSFTSAIEQCRSHRGEIRLVLVDWIMPDVCGPELCLALLAEAQGIPLMVCSGTILDEGTKSDLTDAGVAGFLRKPVRMQSLADVLEGLLECSA